MTKQDDLVEIISTLINRKIEGTYWDFKRKHHKNNSDLIHDVLCLANAKHTGDRFLIFGVDDKEFSLHPINEDTGRRSQADLASLFRDNAKKFFQSRFPEFYLKEIELDETLLDVLVIEDTPYKPYYLVENYKKIRAHHIYTRISDTNTPVNDAAQPHEIERMWRERFGLDMPPLERAKRYLIEPDAWAHLDEGDGSNMNFYHTAFPEFILRVAKAEDYMDRHQEWTRGEIRKDNNYAGYYVSIITRPDWPASITSVLMITRNQWWHLIGSLAELDVSISTRQIALITLFKNFTPLSGGMIPQHLP